MKLVGENIIIRDLNLKDIDDYYEYGSQADVGPNAGWKPFPSKDIARRVLSGAMLSKETFAIALKDSNKLIGCMNIYSNCIRKYNKARQLGFSLNHDYWGNGYMTEAVKLVINYIFNKTNIEVIEVGHHSDNYMSKRVIEKCGFTYDGRLCKFKKLYDGRLIDADFYSITREDFERMMKYE